MRMIVKAFNAAKIKVECPYDMLKWIWLHMAINAGVITTAAKCSGTQDTVQVARALMVSRCALAETIFMICETLEIIRVRGVPLRHYRNAVVPYKIPAGLGARIMVKMFVGNALTSRIMCLHSNCKDLMYVCSQVYHCGQQSNVKTALFTQNYASFADSLKQS